MDVRHLPRVPPERLGVFLAVEACAVGWTPSSLRRAVVAGRLLRLRRGVYVEAGLDAALHPSQQARRDRARCSIAAALVTTGSVAGALAVATIADLRVWAPREQACLTVPYRQATSIDGVHLHRGWVRPEARRSVAGFEITTPTRTAIDVAREYGTEAGLVVADAAVEAGLTTPALLLDEVGRLIGRRGVGRARPLPELVDPRSESVLESRSRWQFVRHELPAPTPQMWIYDLDGRFLGRTDFYWADGVIGEVDGAGKLEEASARRALLERQLALGRRRLRIVRWGEADLRAFDPVAAWIREELAAAAADPRPRRWFASPRRLGSEFAVGALLAAHSDPSRC